MSYPNHFWNEQPSPYSQYPPADPPTASSSTEDGDFTGSRRGEFQDVDDSRKWTSEASPRDDPQTVDQPWQPDTTRTDTADWSRDDLENHGWDELDPDDLFGDEQHAPLTHIDLGRGFGDVIRGRAIRPGSLNLKGVGYRSKVEVENDEEKEISSGWFLELLDEELKDEAEKKGRIEQSFGKVNEYKNELVMRWVKQYDMVLKDKQALEKDYYAGPGHTRKEARIAQEQLRIKRMEDLKNRRRSLQRQVTEPSLRNRSPQHDGWDHSQGGGWPEVNKQAEETELQPSSSTATTISAAARRDRQGYPKAPPGGPDLLLINVKTQLKLLPVIQALNPARHPIDISVLRSTTDAASAVCAWAAENDAPAALQGRCAFYAGLAEYLKDRVEGKGVLPTTVMAFENCVSLADGAYSEARWAEQWVRYLTRTGADNEDAMPERQDTWFEYIKKGVKGLMPGVKKGREQRMRPRPLNIRRRVLSDGPTTAELEKQRGRSTVSSEEFPHRPERVPTFESEHTESRPGSHGSLLRSGDSETVIPVNGGLGGLVSDADLATRKKMAGSYGQEPAGALSTKATIISPERGIFESPESMEMSFTAWDALPQRAPRDKPASAILTKKTTADVTERKGYRIANPDSPSTPSSEGGNSTEGPESARAKSVSGITPVRAHKPGNARTMHYFGQGGIESTGSRPKSMPPSTKSAETLRGTPLPAPVTTSSPTTSPLSDRMRRASKYAIDALSPTGDSSTSPKARKPVTTSLVEEDEEAGNAGTGRRLSTSNRRKSSISALSDRVRSLVSPKKLVIPSEESLAEEGESPWKAEFDEKDKDKIRRPTMRDGDELTRAEGMA